MKTILLFLFLLGIHIPGHSQHFDLSLGAALGSSQMDGDKLYGFDKFIYKVWLQPSYKHNKILSTVFRLGFGKNGSRYPGTDIQNNITRFKVSHDFSEFYFTLGEQISFGGKDKDDPRHRFLLGFSFNRNFNWTTSTNQNKFANPQYIVDPISFKNQGISFHLSYLNRLYKGLSWTVIFDYYVTDLLDVQFLDVRSIYPVTLGIGLQIDL